jgi:hypothetical protein
VSLTLIAGPSVPIVVYFVYPETMGVPLEEMDRLFNDTNTAGNDLESAALLRSSLDPSPSNVVRKRPSNTSRKSSATKVPVAMTESNIASIWNPLNMFRVAEGSRPGSRNGNHTGGTKDYQSVNRNEGDREE